MTKDLMMPLEIPYICTLIYEAFRIPVFHLDTSGGLEYALPANFSAPPSAKDTPAMLAAALRHAGETKETVYPDAASLPFIYTTRYLENFMIWRLPPGLHTAGILIVGPSISVSLTPENTASLLRDHDIPSTRHEQWLNYYSTLPVLSRMRLYHAAILLYTLVTGHPLSINELLIDTRTMNALPETDTSPDLDVSYRREQTWLHHDPMLEKSLFLHIRNGDKAALLQAHMSFSEEQFGLLSRKSQLRSKKNLAISSITLATRAAIDGGLFWEIAYTLSDWHIQHIEELRDIPAVENAQMMALCDFADHVKDNRRSRLSRTAALCQNYIFNHLYEELSLDRLAEVAGLNGSYLSQLFKKETGFTISDYIQRERIEEAKRLMDSSSITLSDIASRLHFNDQSYFTKVFKKYTGVTPKQFRNRQGLYN
ncbi:AraC family transcriptional regulator [Paenibacillus albidus]|uniref:AraC family transcriptional regulator n=1 Tax=Paenibacillus albidus TaxID=2041023 RepID=UPI001BEA1C54|nr:AraC family transcriptional regulator [Paenibacillus albidus]MBT2288794.1 AraC family transcriptional regulator [Paenibacillus albidus]